MPGWFRPGLRIHGSCLIRDSEARKTPYILASLLASFLFLLFLKHFDVHVADVHGLGLITVLPRTHMENIVWKMNLSVMVPGKCVLLSFIVLPDLQLPCLQKHWQLQLFPCRSASQRVSWKLGCSRFLKLHKPEKRGDRSLKCTCKLNLLCCEPVFRDLDILCHSPTVDPFMLVLEEDCNIKNLWLPFGHLLLSPQRERDLGNEEDLTSTRN